MKQPYTSKGIDISRTVFCSLAHAEIPSNTLRNVTGTNNLRHNRKAGNMLNKGLFLFPDSAYQVTDKIQSLYMFVFLPCFYFQICIICANLHTVIYLRLCMRCFRTSLQPECTPRRANCTDGHSNSQKTHSYPLQGISNDMHGIGWWFLP